jgi:hypothetical protein
VDFKLVQISDHAIHTGGVCTGGLSCDSSPQANRDLLDFLTIDVNHTGAAYTTWADDNNSRHDTRQFFSRQLSGASIFKGQNIAAMNAYPITDHAVTDPGGDVTDAIGEPKACPSMDVLGTSAQRNGDLLTVSLSLASADSEARHSRLACGSLSGTPTLADAATPCDVNGTGTVGG